MAEVANLLSSASCGVPEFFTQLYGDTVFPPWESFIVFCSLPPRLFDACKCILVVFLVGSGVWLLVVNVKITWGPSSEGIQGRPGILLTAATYVNCIHATWSIVNSIFHILLVEFPLPKAATSYPKLWSAGNLGWMPVDVVNTDLIFLKYNRVF